MSVIGNTLKEARNKKAVTLEEVHAKTKIHPRVLQLLEEEKFEKLPSPLFVKSFLKTYAEFLEVNPQELLQAYEKEGKKEPDQVLFIKPSGERVSASAGLSKNLLVIPALILTVVFALFLLVNTLKAVGHFFAPKNKKTVVIQKAAADTSKPAAAPQKAPDPSWLYQASQGNFPKIAEKASIKLKIHAHNDVWLRVTCDGKVLFESILKKSATESWAADKTIEIWTGNLSSTRLSVNGVSLKPSVNKTPVKKMLVSHEGIKIVA